MESKQKENDLIKVAFEKQITKSMTNMLSTEN